MNGENVNKINLKTCLIGEQNINANNALSASGKKQSTVLYWFITYRARYATFAAG